MKNIQYKGWLKLIIQIGLLSVSMMMLSFLTETEFFNKYFEVYNESFDYFTPNYRGMVYYITGFAYFVMSVIRILFSHEEEDFE